MRRLHGMRRICVLAGLSLVWGCGGAPPALKEAEDAVNAQRWDAAERAYARAGKGYLSPREREAVRAGRRKIAEGRVLTRVRAAEKTPGRDGLKAIAEVRTWYWRNGGEPGSEGDQAVVAAMVRRIEALWPAAEAPASKGFYLPALDGVQALLAPLGRDVPKPLADRLADLRARAAAHHAAPPAGAPTGAQAFHTNLRAQLTASPKSDAAAAVAKEVSVGLAATRAGAGCAAEADRVVSQLKRAGAVSAQVRVTLTRCEPTQRVSTRQVTYQYTEKVPYQETVRVQVGTDQVRTQSKTCSTTLPVLRPNGKGGYDKYEVTRTSDCSTYKSVPRYESRVVTKYRDVARTGTRTVRTEQNAVSLAATLQVTWAGGDVPLTVSAGAKATDTAYQSPHGSKRIDSDKTLSGLTNQAIAVLAQRAREKAQAAVAAERAAVWLREAQAADAAGDVATSEDRDVRAVIIAGKVNRATAARFARRYGLDAAAVQRVVQGAAPTFAEAEWAAKASDRNVKVGRQVSKDDMEGLGLIERGYTVGVVGMGVNRVSSVGLPVQGDREAYGFSMRVAYPALTAAADMSEGWVFQDLFMMDFSVGGRTSEAQRYGADKKEGAIALSARIGYQAQIGLRGDTFGLLVGARTQGIHHRVGDFVAQDSVHPLVGTLEIKIWDRSPMSLEVYGYSLFGDGDVRGGTFDVTLDGVSGLGLRAEQWTLEGRYSGNTANDIIDLDKQTVRTLDLLYLYRF